MGGGGAQGYEGQNYAGVQDDDDEDNDGAGKGKRRKTGVAFGWGGQPWRFCSLAICLTDCNSSDGHKSTGLDGAGSFCCQL